MPYFANPQAWEPNQEIVNGMTLTRLDSFFAVLAPADKTQIESYADYKELLAQRIEWMIQEWMEDAQVTLPEVDQMIRRRLRDDSVPEMPMPSPEEATPASWAAALADSQWMSTIWTLEIAPASYPLPMAQGEAREDIAITIEEQSLEEWLLFFSKTGN